MNSKTPLLLMEQMVMLLVFALAAAICLQAFVCADTLSVANAARDEAVLITQSAAELICLNGGDLEAAAEQLEAVCEQGILQKQYNAGRQDVVCQLQAEIMPSAQSGLGTAFVQVLDENGQRLFGLEVCWQEVANND